MKKQSVLIVLFASIFLSLGVISAYAVPEAVRYLASKPIIPVVEVPSCITCLADSDAKSCVKTCVNDLSSLSTWEVTLYATQCVLLAPVLSPLMTPSCLLLGDIVLSYVD